MKLRMKFERLGFNSFPLRQPTHCGQDAVKDFGGFGRTAGHENVHWNDVRHAADDSVAALENATMLCAVPNRNHELRCRSCLVGLEQRDFHVTRHRPGHEEHVSVAWRGHEVNAEALAVI